MLAEAQISQRFVRRTQLAPNEYRKNFHQIDREVMTVVTSEEADQVTPLMSKIYLRMVNAPERFWEREGVLRIEAEVRDERLLKAWGVLCDLVGVASGTASKAIRWMHEQGIIGYFSGKNGVGMRIFLNRAVSSIGVRQAQPNKKILAFPPASSEGGHTSANEPAFNDSFAVREISDSDINPGAPKNGADKQNVFKTSSEKRPGTHFHPKPETVGAISLDDVVLRLKAELEPSMRAVASQAATREHERTREWLESRGLPKAARVAQHEAYNVLRKYGVISEQAHKTRAAAEIGKADNAPQRPHPLSPDEINDLAAACLAMLEAKGQSIEVTMSEMSCEAGGFLLPEDAPRVRARANELLSAGGCKEVRPEEA